MPLSGGVYTEKRERRGNGEVKSWNLDRRVLIPSKFGGCSFARVTRRIIDRIRRHLIYALMPTFAAAIWKPKASPLSVPFPLDPHYGPPCVSSADQAGGTVSRIPYKRKRRAFRRYLEQAGVGKVY